LARQQKKKTYGASLKRELLCITEHCQVHEIAAHGTEENIYKSCIYFGINTQNKELLNSTTKSNNKFFKKMDM
jgi:hypothetical protein